MSVDCDGVREDLRGQPLAMVLPRGSVRDCIELMKPRLALLVLMTTGVGFWLGARTGHTLPLLALG